MPKIAEIIRIVSSMFSPEHWLAPDVKKGTPLGYEKGYKPKKERGCNIHCAWPYIEIERAKPCI